MLGNRWAARWGAWLFPWLFPWLSAAHAQPAPEPAPEFSTADVVVDLARLEPGRSTSLTTTSGLRRLRLANRAPGAHYRASVADPGATPRQLDLPAPLPSELASGATPPHCGEWWLQYFDLLLTVEEGQVEAKLAGLRRAPRCREADDAGFALVERARPSLGEVRLMPGKRVALQVERLDPSGAPVRRWDVVVEVPGTLLSSSEADEGSWLVAATVRDIAMLAQFARGGRLQPAQVSVVRRNAGERPPRYTVRVQSAPEAAPVSQDLAPREHVWSPATYTGLAERLLAGLRPAARSGDSPALLAALSDLRATVIEGENRRVSAALAARPLDPGMHEQAAFLLGALGLREAAGAFSDLRPTLCAMAAHLTLAQALSAGTPPGPEGRLAGALLDLLAGRHLPAAERVRALRLTAATPAEKPWLNVIELRATGDWRKLEQPAKASLAERLAFVHALTVGGSEERVLDFFEQRVPEPLPDWGRVLLEGRASVALGNALALDALDGELNEAGQVLQAGVQAGAQPGAVARAIAAAPLDAARLGAGSAPLVLTAGFWAAHYERHVLHAASVQTGHLQRRLGLKTEARADRAASLEILQTLPLVGLARLGAARADDRYGPARDRACEALRELLTRRPERLTAAWWGFVLRSCAELHGRGALPDMALWFDPALPAGTAYDADRRIASHGLRRGLGPAEAQELYALSPRTPEVLELYAREKLGRDPTSEDVRAAWGGALDHDLTALRRVARLKAGDSAEHLRLRAQLCELEAIECIDYGDALVDEGQLEKAAAAFGRAVAHARDRVGVANGSDWLVGFELEQGRVERAVVLATAAASTGSSGGLRTLGRLLERLGRYPEAEAVYRQDEQRYDASKSLQSFYIRHERRIGDGAYRDQAAGALKTLFPAGLVEVHASGLPAGDDGRGIVVTADWLSARYRRVGLQLGDTIVAVDGLRVHTPAQYFCVRSLVDEQRIALTVRRGAGLVELKGDFPRARFGPVPAAKLKEPGRRARVNRSRPPFAL